LSFVSLSWSRITDKLAIRAEEPERPEPLHDLAEHGAGVGAILFFFRSRNTLKNWKGAGAGVGAGVN